MQSCQRYNFAYTYIHRRLLVKYYIQEHFALFNFVMNEPEAMLSIGSQRKNGIRQQNWCVSTSETNGGQKISNLGSIRISVKKEKLCQSRLFDAPCFCQFWAPHPLPFVRSTSLQILVALQKEGVALASKSFCRSGSRTFSWIQCSHNKYYSARICQWKQNWTAT